MTTSTHFSRSHTGVGVIVWCFMQNTLLKRLFRHRLQRLGPQNGRPKLIEVRVQLSLIERGRRQLVLSCTQFPGFLSVCRTRVLKSLRPKTVGTFFDKKKKTASNVRLRVE